jgi:hypothetical protein
MPDAPAPELSIEQIIKALDEILDGLAYGRALATAIEVGLLDTEDSAGDESTT